MDNKLYDKLLNELIEIKSKINEEDSKKLDLDILERIIKRLYSFECEECNKYLEEINYQISIINQDNSDLSEIDIKKYNELKNNIISHLQKEHKLVTEGYYLGICLSLGLSIGLLVGTIIFDNTSLYLPIGLSLGIGIGIAKDEEARKKGLVI